MKVFVLVRSMSVRGGFTVTVENGQFPPIEEIMAALPARFRHRDMSMHLLMDSWDGYEKHIGNYFEKGRQAWEVSFYRVDGDLSVLT